MIIKFEWDSAKGKMHNDKSIIIGHLLNLNYKNLDSLEIYGLSIDVVDNTKDYKLKRFSCDQKNIQFDIKEISKHEARELLYEEIDKALDVLFKKHELLPQNLNFDKEGDEIG